MASGVPHPRNSTGPLAGVRIVDLCQYQNGPSAVARLADNGADVIKVEPPEGDGMRFAVIPGAHFGQVETFNRGKRSIALDLKHKDAAAIMERLVKWADVLAENFRPGIMDKLGFGYERCKEWNPNIIYASNSGYGPVGAWAMRPSYDAVAQGFAGSMNKQGGGPSHEPKEIQFAFSDEVGATNFCFSIVNALLARERTGKAQKLETSQTGASLDFQRHEFQNALYYGRIKKDQDTGLPPYGHYHMQQKRRCADGKWIVLQLMKTAMFERFCTQVIRRPDLMTEKVMKTWPGPPEEICKWIAAESAMEMAKKPQQYWLDACLSADVPCAPVNSYEEIADHTTSVGKHFLDNGYTRHVQHREFGKMIVVGPPTVYHGTPNGVPSSNESWHSPELGEHTAEILHSVLGFSAEETREMQQGVAKPVGPLVSEAAKQVRERIKSRFNRPPEEPTPHAKL
mmetsp:Transcript_113774/g.332305  ORF Transcript_113774/g.332305 Transcript_113774/m.332305 type:complete len:455 (-) Transcript_113774:107-1471(-)